MGKLKFREGNSLTREAAQHSGGNQPEFNSWVSRPLWITSSSKNKSYAIARAARNLAVQ